MSSMHRSASATCMSIWIRGCAASSRAARAKKTRTTVPRLKSAFASCLKSFPKHALAPNAQYWIGESYAHQRQYREAIEAERRLLGTYPDSAKAPDALLIIGTAESSLGDNAAARKTFEELIAKYPASDSAEKAKGRLAKLK